MRHYAPRARLVLVDGQRELLEEIAQARPASGGWGDAAGWLGARARRGLCFAGGRGAMRRFWRGCCTSGCGIWMSAG